MKPTNIQEKGCNPVSSDCVIWQGPDLGCINLCKGDSVSTVIYNLATELCSLMDTFGISNYDISCFNLGSCGPKDFAELIQLLIGKICSLEEISTEEVTVSGCPDCEVDVCETFYVRTPQGDTITKMQLADYVRAIGVRVCALVGTIEVINEKIEDHEERITILESIEAKIAGIVNLPLMNPVCVMDRTEVPMIDVLVALEAQYCAFLSVTGSSLEIISSFQNMCVNGYTDQLTDPGANLEDAGWVDSTTLAGNFGNTWVTLCDIRTALINITNVVTALEESTGEAALFDSHRPTKRIGIPEVTANGDTVNDFLEAYFFPFLSASITINGNLLYEYGNEIDITIAGNLVVEDETIFSDITVFRPSDGDSIVGTLPPANYSIDDPSVTLPTTYQAKCTVDNNGSPIDILSGIKSVNFVHPYLYGMSALVLTGVNLYTELTKLIQTVGSKVVPLGGTDEFIYFAYPASYGALASIKDQSNLDVTGSFTEQPSVLVQSAGLATNWTVEYRVYKTDTLTAVTAGSLFTFNK